ncbi:MAG: YjcZ family sporulation protein [Acholeplasmataceae bacterium]|nr:YjcZ family sporulation protein [Acholeplasmataceae bacterium]HOA63508.1 YjcZ family sporulation protein [Bacilli bacterium]HPT88928.1 YjcZ family sporulation protein [Bacilli bacterium]HQA19508.1 YjcZ family sporulation protein [Bacilli bacterium]HQD91827.1 YjcZ family sporulation protein [Bacilli bacterium]
MHKMCRRGNNFALILVLFILLVIIGASWMY